MRRSLAALLLILLVLTGCTLAPKAEQSAKNEGPTKGTIRLLTMGALGLEPTLINAFKMAYPDVVIESADMPEGDFATVVTKLQSGEAGIDVIIAPGNSFLFREGAVVPLDDWIKAMKVDTAPYGNAQKFGTYEGKVYGLPVMLSPMAVVYNQDLLTQVGAKTPAAGWSWDQFAETARLLNPVMAGKEEAAGAAIVPWVAVDMLLSAGEGPAGTDLSALEDTLTRLHQYEVVEKILPTEVLGQTETDYFSKFSAGEIGMLLNYWNFSLAHAKPEFAWGVAPLPGGKDQPTPATAILAMVTPSAQNTELAFKFASYAAGPMGAQAVASMPGAPIPGYVEENIERIWLANTQLPPEAAFMLHLDYVPPAYYPQEVGLMLLKEIDATLSGKKSPADAIADFKQAREPLLSNN